MTELYYLTDSYARECDTVVAAANGNLVELRETVFYPGGGGQPCDEGWLRADAQEWRVTKVHKMDGKIWHTIEGEPPSVGATVHAVLDWDRRYQLMRTHTALHILCGVVWRDYGAQVTGGNMNPLSGRMDFEFEHMQKELVQEIEQRINAEVAAGRAVRVAILPRAEAFQIPDLIRTKINLLPPQIAEVRTVEIVGLDLQADGGTHVANTREVGAIRVVDYKSKGKINKRIMIELD